MANDDTTSLHVVLDDRRLHHNNNHDKNFDSNVHPKRTSTGSISKSTKIMNSTDLYNNMIDDCMGSDNNGSTSNRSSSSSLENYPTTAAIFPEDDFEIVSPESSSPNIEDGADVVVTNNSMDDQASEMTLRRNNRSRIATSVKTKTSTVSKQNNCGAVSSSNSGLRSWSTQQKQQQSMILNVGVSQTRQSYQQQQLYSTQQLQQPQLLHGPNSAMYYQHRGRTENGTRQPQMWLVRHEELVPLTDHSDPSYVGTSRKALRCSKNGKRKKLRTVAGGVSNIDARRSFGSINDDKINNNKHRRNSADAGSDEDIEDIASSGIIDYNSYLLEGQNGVDSNSQSAPPVDFYYGTAFEKGSNKLYVARRKSCLEQSAILISTITVFLCGTSLLVFFLVGSDRAIRQNGVQSNYAATTTTVGERWDLLKDSAARTVKLNESTSSNSSRGISPVQYMQLVQDTYYDEFGKYYKVDDYDIQKPFANFLPGLAGFYGKPLYAFYVNRGQGISSFGIESKQTPIQEYYSANDAYQNTPFIGFRTFLQGIRQPLVSTTASNKSNYPFHWFSSERSKHTKNQDKYRPFVIEPFSPTTSRSSKMSTQNSADAEVFYDAYATPAGTSDEANARNNNNNLPKRYMYIGSNEMKIQEIDIVHGIETNVTYFTLPEEDFGSFARRVVVTNIDTETILNLSAIDGLARIQPAGGNEMNYFLKNMGRTLQGWMGVYQVYNDTFQMPYYRLSTIPTDDAEVVVEKSGHWCISILEQEEQMLPNVLLPVIFDPDVIFGDDTALLRPSKLYTNSIQSILHQQKQYGSAKTASAFAAAEGIVLQPHQSLTITTYFGKADDILDVPVIARRLLQYGFGSYKMNRAMELTSQITNCVETTTSSILFNRHIQQMFLDNSLRGGIPFILGEIDDDARMRNFDEDPRLKVFHLFSRVHGDLERDDTNFVIKSTFFSEGPGNFRDVIQNRRNDAMINPRIGSFNVKTFLSFIQADAYEPLTVEAVVFTIRSKIDCERVATRAIGEADGHRAQREALTEILHAGPFRPGQLFELMAQQNIELMISRQEFIDVVAAAATYVPVAEYTKGFWADHWTYYLDLIESYLSVYPDWEKRIMFEETLPYFFSPAFIKPRRSKYVLSVSFDGNGKHVRQLNATDDADPSKLEEIRRIQSVTGWFESDCDWQHNAKGEVFQSTPIAKLFLLGALKFATRDAYGMGIEYEGGKPGWNDANNGLVGMLGSGMPETFELVSLLRYIHRTIQKYHQGITIPIELHDLVITIQDKLVELSVTYADNDVLYPTVPPGLFRYWDAVANARELYRERTKIAFSGETIILTAVQASHMLEGWLRELDFGIQRAMKFGTRGKGDDGSYGITPTYFSYNVTRWNVTGEVNVLGHQFVHPQEMVVSLFPLFLEGPTRMLQIIKTSANDESSTSTPNEAKMLYDKVRTSPLRDTGLHMYTVSASLQGQSIDMGREMAFAPGWLENQSVWLHMSYKFYLQLLRHGLYDEFFEEMLGGGILPFMNPHQYGRSLMECSSFIASSAFDDPNKHGRGFLARLSGSTAEYLSIWVLMMIGPNPFTVNPKNGHLQFQLKPALPRWLFNDGTSHHLMQQNVSPSNSNINEVTLSFKLFGSIDVTYHHNRGDENLYGVIPSRYEILLQDGTTYKIDGGIISGDLAEKIRRVVFVSSIDAYYDM